jgi:hypothetical protein
VQWRFYTEVLPGFGTGDYNGLTVPIGLFGNHSVPNLLNQILPGGNSLTSLGRALSVGFNMALLVGLAMAFSQHRTKDLLIRASQVGAMCIAMLLVPVYTYEHHLVWALPAVVALVVAVAQGRLSDRWVVPIACSIAVWAFSLSDLKHLKETLDIAPVGWVIQELKFVSLAVLIAACTWLGSRPEPEPQRAVGVSV